MKFGRLLKIRMSGYPHQAVTLFLFSLMFSTIILGAAVVYSACVNAGQNVGKYTDGSIQIKSYDEMDEAEEEDEYTAEGQKIAYDWVKELGTDQRITNYEVTAMAGVHGENVTHMLLNDEAIDQGDQKGNLLLVYERNMMEHYLFRDYGESIMEGRSLVEGERGSKAVVSKTFAEGNTIQVGDRIALRTLSGDVISLEIVGISSCEYLGNIVVPVRAAEYNYIFTTKEIVDQANESTNVFRADFKLADCKDADVIMNEIQESSRGLEYAVTAQLTEYHTILAGLVNSQTTVSVLKITAIVMGAFITGLFSVYSLTRRLKEIGILISLGFRKRMIIAQYVLEVYLPVFVGNICCLGIFALIKKPLTGLLLSRIIIPDMTISFGVPQIIEYFGCGLFMIVFSAVFVWYTVVKYQPKKLLMEVDES